MTKISQIYALFSYTYDHYEWEDIEAVSFDKEKLVEYYNNDKKLPLANTQKEHDVFAINEHSHCWIRPIDFLGDIPQTGTADTLSK